MTIQNSGLQNSAPDTAECLSLHPIHEPAPDQCAACRDQEQAPTPVHQVQTRQGTDHIRQDRSPDQHLLTEDVHTDGDCLPESPQVTTPGNSQLSTSAIRMRTRQIAAYMAQDCHRTQPAQAMK